MICQSEDIYHKASALVKKYKTRNTLKLAHEMGIHVHFIDDFTDLLGMYTCMNRVRHILLNSKMDESLTQMVCGHEIGHDMLHRSYTKDNFYMSEYALFNNIQKQECEANAFASHLIIDNDELMEALKQGYNVDQLASYFVTDVNLIQIKLNELKKTGWDLNISYVPRPDFLKNISANVPYSHHYNHT